MSTCLRIRLTCPFHDGASSGKSRKGSMCGSSGGTLAARVQRVVIALLLLRVESSRSIGLGVCQALPRQMRS